MHSPSGCKKCRRRRTPNTSRYSDLNNYSKMVKNKKQNARQYMVKSAAGCASTRIFFHKPANEIDIIQN